MRPLPGDDAFARPRSRDNGSSSAFPLAQGHQHPGSPVTYVLADESTVDVALEHASALLPRPGGPRKRQSHDAVSTSSSSSSDKEKDKHKDRDADRTSPRTDDAISIASRPESPALNRTSNPSTVFRPMTPSLLGTPGPASALSSVSSRRNSFSGSFLDDLTASQVLSVDNGDDRNSEADDMLDSGSTAAPQLIMPSIKMPSRRPFTDAGKAMGRLKVLIAGDSGIGKTSLIKAIVQSCDHIVHVDPIAPSSVSLPYQRATNPPGPRGSRRQYGPRLDMGTSQITEIYASTKPYPEWWGELDDSRVLKRRKSVDDAVLDRNICFVDTPGYSSAPSAMETMSQVVQYVESQLRRMNSNTLSDGEMLNMLAGDGGVQVDVVFYMMTNRPKPVDMEYLRQLAPLTNVVVLLARSDLLTAEQISAAKQQIRSQLLEANVKPFRFTVSSPSSAEHGSSDHEPYAISSALGSDHEIMDASLLMSPDYVQPLISTELALLVEQVFNQNGISWLRHAAARKFLQWQNLETPCPARPLAVRNPLSHYGSPMNSHTQHQQLVPLPTCSQVLAPGTLGAASSFTLARVTDHTQREERLAQIRLANWASDLQRSLANERARYESLARGERAVWLTERLNECVQDGTLVAIRGREVASKRKRPAGPGAVGSAVQQQQDPLGLLEVAAELRRKGIVALEVLGSLGVIGGVALWLSRNLQGYPWTPPLPEWERLWYGVR